MQGQRQMRYQILFADVNRRFPHHAKFAYLSAGVSVEYSLRAWGAFHGKYRIDRTALVVGWWRCRRRKACSPSVAASASERRAGVSVAAPWNSYWDTYTAISHQRRRAVC